MAETLVCLSVRRSTTNSLIICSIELNKNKILLHVEDLLLMVSGGSVGVHVDVDGGCSVPGLGKQVYLFSPGKS